MPPLPAVADVLKCQVLWSDAGDTGVSSTIYLQYSGDSPDGADCSAIAGDINALFASHAGLWDIETALQGTTVTDLNTDDGATGEATDSVQGTRSGGILAGGTALVISYSIARRYRGGRPRNYFPWGTPTDLVNRQGWDESFVTAAGTAWTAISNGLKAITQGATAITNHVNVSYYSGSTATIVGPAGSQRGKTVATRRATPLVNPTTNFLVQPFPGSQRRRNR